MKILWMSDSPTSPSGFGNVTRFVCAALACRGHQVSILGWQTRGSPELWSNCTLYPIRYNSFGADVLLTYLHRVRPDVLVTLADIWWLAYIKDPGIANFMRTACIPWALYYPIDGDMGNGRLPPSWMRVLKTVDLPITMSHYGRYVTQANGVTPAYIPHGIDTTIFQPPSNKTIAKRAYGYDNRFVVLSDARNQPRKLLPRTLEVFRRFALGKDDVLLHLHCDPDDLAARTPEYYYDLRSDIKFMGLSEKVRFTTGMSIETGIPLDQLAALYQAADVHLLSSWGEGFGLPTLQAAATGVVPLASDYAASRELTLGHGEAIQVRHFVRDQFGLRRALIDVSDAAERLERLYNDRRLLASKSKAAHSFGTSYDWERITPEWHDLLHNEVPHLRSRLRHPAVTSRVSIHPGSADRSSDAASVVSSVLPDLPYGAKLTINVLESRAGELTAEILRDASESEQAITLPVTLPPTDPSMVEARITGCLYLAGPSDVPVLHALSRIFPRLSVWSSVPLDLGPSTAVGQAYQAKVVSVSDPAYHRYLAASTLALDLAGANRDLPMQAAEAGVPCIGMARHPKQLDLWPDLSLGVPDPAIAAEVGRWVLTDQGYAAEICASAHRQLIAALRTPASLRRTS
jgi:glycosyltransferase involved in cell wall biosynthesis